MKQNPIGQAVRSKTFDIGTAITLWIAGLGLFFFSLPIIDSLTHPFSVLSEIGKPPLILQIPEFFEKSGIATAAYKMIPVIFAGILLITRIRKMRVLRALLFLLVPFYLALVFWYFVAVGLDQQLRHGVEWRIVFQLPYMMAFFLPALVYSVASFVLLWISRFFPDHEKCWEHAIFCMVSWFCLASVPILALLGIPFRWEGLAYSLLGGPFIFLGLISFLWGFSWFLKRHQSTGNG